MTTISRPQPGAAGKPERDEEAAAARLSAMLTDPATPPHVFARADRLIEILSVEVLDSAVESTPVILAEHYRQAAPRATGKKARRALAELDALAERYAPREAAEVGALAHHMAEMLRIMGAAEWIPARVYNHFAEGFNDIQNLVNRDPFLHSEAHVRLYLAELAKRGGAE